MERHVTPVGVAWRSRAFPWGGRPTDAGHPRTASGASEPTPSALTHILSLRRVLAGLEPAPSGPFVHA